MPVVTKPTSELSWYAISERSISIKYDGNGVTYSGGNTISTQRWNQYENQIQSVSLKVTTTTLTRKGHTFLGWSTNKNASQAEYAGGSTYNFNNGYSDSANVTLYAVWKVNSYKVRIYAMTGISDIKQPATSWSTDSVGRYKEVSVNYGTSYTMEVSVSTGYAFDRWTYYNDSNGDILSSNTTYIFTLDDQDYTFYTFARAKNPAYQDASGKWYVEMGYFPQSKVTNSTLKNNIKTSGKATGVTYSIVGQTLKEYEYGSDKYALYNGEYYKVEPVRYILQSSSSLKDGYATESGSILAVSEKIVFASVFQTGWTASNCFGKGYNNAQIKNNVSAFVSGSFANDGYLNSKKYSVANFKMANGTTSSSDISTKAIASSESEIQSVFGDLSAEFSDLVTDILGGYLFYWTRDVGSNLNNAQTISTGGVTGTQMNMQNILGVRITVNIKTLVCS